VTYHPLTERVAALVDHDGWTVHTDDVDTLIRDYVDPKPVVVESGVRFPANPDVRTEVAATFIQSGNQMQMAIIGTEPVLLVQPEYDADENAVTLITTAVDLDPAGLVQTLEVMLDAARLMAEQQAAAIQEQIEADDALRQASDEFDLSHKPDANGGSRVL